MLMVMKTTLFISLCLFVSVCRGQHVHYTLNTEHTADTLIDTITAMEFILDTSRVYISAIDAKGKLLWKTDPWKDNRLDEYRIKRPIISSFYFANNQWTKNKEIIWIVYNNTQFGIVDKKTGTFTWFGQD